MPWNDIIGFSMLIVILIMVSFTIFKLVGIKSFKDLQI